jgi:signal transduction histidine kinase
MDAERISVLIVEDDPDQALLAERTLRRQEPPFEVARVETGAACLEALTERVYSVVLLDYSLPRMNGLDVLAEIRGRELSVPVVMVTAQGDERIAVEAMKAGAVDYLVKTAAYLTTLPTVIHKVLKQHELAVENRRLYAEAQRSLAELQAAQEQLVRGETLRALGEVASGAAHHLNNLLAVILGRVQMLLRTPGDAAAVTRSLGMVQRATVDAAEVVRRLQRFARLAPAEDRHPVDLRDVAREVTEMTRVRWHDEAQARGIPIDVVLELDPVPTVIGNAPALREVITNLVLNAVDALPGGGRVVVRTFPDGGHACVTVADTGVGMAADVSQRALEPFFTTKGPKGTGLGLSVSYGVAKSHGGELRIDSIPGQGTTVSLRLPAVVSVTAPVEHAAPDGAACVPPTPARRLLIVDDEAAVGDALAAMAASLGHEVARAGSGYDALALLATGERVDLVLTDLGMPEMTGWELARAIKRRWPALPLGLVTGWGANVEAPDRKLLAGILAKPVLMGDLARFVADATSADARPVVSAATS